MIAHNQIGYSMFSVGKTKSMEGFYLESCSLFNTTLHLNIILGCEIFTLSSEFIRRIVAIVIHGDFLFFNLCWRFSN